MPFPWLKLGRKSQVVAEAEPPINLGNRSNGEYFHAQTQHERRIRDAILRRADELSRRAGLDRREFLASSMGMATSLWAINMAACGGGGSGQSSSGNQSGSSSGGTSGSHGTGGSVDGSTGGLYDVGDNPLETGTSGGSRECTDPLQPALPFIVDVQTHHVNPEGAWRETNPGYVDFFYDLPQAACGVDPIECFSAHHYIEQMFLNSDTAVAVLSGIPATICSRNSTGNCGNPLTNEEIVQTRELVNALADSQRCINHCMITPNVDLDLQLELMQQVQEELGVGGWKCYPPWGPTGSGWWLDDPSIGIPFIERGLELGINVFCIHKGLPLPGFDGTHTDPRDIGVVAKMFPEAKFVVYHSAWLHGGFGNGEGPYDPEGMIDPSNPTLFPVDQGVNSLIQSLVNNDVAPGSNVYAELGSVWTNLLAYPQQAAHVIGKLLRHVGEDNVLWGTDCIWTGSPQSLVEAFAAFQISAQFQETYGYPALSEAIKAKIFGLNAAVVFGIDPDAIRCEIDVGDLGRMRKRLDAELGPRRWTATPAAGPRTRREFTTFLRMNGGPK